MMADKNRALLIFARTPIPKTVKKRLAQTIGEKSALHCYNLLLKKTITHSMKVTACRFLYCHPDKIEAIPDRPQPLTSHFTLRCQKPDTDLGQKMVAAFSETLYNDNFATAVLIGSDIPFLHTEIIEQAFFKLATTDIVLGPAVDGGYYLIGLQRQALNRAEIFQGIPWSTDQVYKTTVSKARMEGLNVATLPPLFDVDTLADLKKWQWLEKEPTIAIHLSEILQQYKTNNQQQQNCNPVLYLTT